MTYTKSLQVLRVNSQLVVIHYYVGLLHWILRLVLLKATFCIRSSYLFCMVFIVFTSRLFELRTCNVGLFLAAWCIGFCIYEHSALFVALGLLRSFIALKFSYGLYDPRFVYCFGRVIFKVS